MKKSILLICFVISFKSFSVHKNVVRNFQYGNVSGTYITACNNDGNINDFDILTQLTAKLAEKVSYKDPILLFFKHKTSTYKSRFSEIKKDNKAHGKVFGITFNDYNFKKINIWETLKLLEFAMKNDFKQEKRIIIKYSELADELMFKIKKSEESKEIEKLRREQIFFLNKNGIQAYFENKTYHFTNQKITFQTNSLEYLLTLYNGIMVFDTKSTFIYFNSKTTMKKKIELDLYKNLSDFPFYYNSINIYNQKKLKEGIFIYKVRDSKQNGFIFSEEKNEIIDFYNKSNNP
ncbi:hypothetical protein [Aureivirga marina]|uniref:hypothetical protein n=1 Tax=Aureivirga marina TaxID=1182451 RepID=UPI0018C9B9C4|nr:hypothetical protein [Aureivirga marina]